jgi:hypothetical protein
MMFVYRFELKEKKENKKDRITTLKHQRKKQKSILHIKTSSLLHKSELQALIHS